jgi:salicylate hydroxylase
MGNTFDNEERMRMRVAIAGGGIGGLVLARALEGHGIDAEVYEQADELREIGAAVALSANGVRELERLGIGTELAEISAVPSSLCVRDQDGTLISRDAMAEDEIYPRSFGAPYYGVHRVPLLNLLARDVAPTRIHLGHRVVAADAEGALRFADGSSACADVVVGADGVHSAVRQALPFGGRPRFSGTIGYRGLVERKAVPSLPEPSAIQFWAGPGAHLLHYPIADGEIINFLAVARVPEWTADSWMAPCDPRESAERFAGWHLAVQEMVGAVQESARWALHDHSVLEHWHIDRTVLIGDAAHAMLPHQGQGANQTIEDAVALAEHLASADTASVPTALANYEDQRRDRTARVQAWSRRTADVLHLAEDDVDRRNVAFADVPDQLAWIHGHDARAAAQASIERAAYPAVGSIER